MIRKIVKMCGVAFLMTTGTMLSLSLQNPTTVDQSINWQTDYDRALADAKSANKPLFLFFTGSDWCSWCIRLEKEVLSTPEFVNRVKDRFVFVKLDFPMNQSLSSAQMTKNEALKNQFHIQGFPTVVLLKPDGSEIASMGYVAGGGAKYAQNVLDVVAAGG